MQLRGVQTAQFGACYSSCRVPLLTAVLAIAQSSDLVAGGSWL